VSQEILFSIKAGMEIPSGQGAVERLENEMTYFLLEFAEFLCQKTHV
jgi:hypothetical protein